MYISRDNLISIILWGLLIASLSFMFLVISQKNFKASTDFLIVQDQAGTQDFYSLFKSAEYMSNILSSAIYSEVFVDEIVSTGKVEDDFLPSEQKEKLDAWEDMVNVERNTQSGIIKIDIFSDSKTEVLDVSEAIKEVMITKNYLFRGKVSLDVRVLSGPVVEKNPSLKDILIAIVGGFIIGSIISIIKIYYSTAGRKPIVNIANE